MNKLVSLVKVSAKVGLSGLAVYTTYDIGIWGNCKQGEQVYHKLQTTKLKDVLPEEIGNQVPELGVPEELTTAVAAVGDVKKNIWNHYNSVVSGTCEGLSSLPETISGWSKQATEMIKENIK